MLPNRRRALIASSALVAGLGSLTAAVAQNHVVRLIVGSPVGGPPDIAYRSLARKLSEALNQTIVVLNQPVVGGLSMFREVKRSAPDGLTLGGIFSAQATVAPHYLPGVDYDVANDFTHLGIWSAGPTVIATHADSGISTIGQAIELLRRKPNEVPVATQGVSSPGNLYLAQLSQLANLDILAVPYRAGQAQLALLRGEASLIVDGPSALLPHVQAGKVRILAVIGYSGRISVWPEIPHIRETGLLERYDGMDIETWMGLIAPKGLSEATVQKLRLAMGSAVADSTFRKEHELLLRRIELSSQADMGQRIRRESEFWKPVVNNIGLEKFK